MMNHKLASLKGHIECIVETGSASYAGHAMKRYIILNSPTDVVLKYPRELMAQPLYHSCCQGDVECRWNVLHSNVK